VVYLEALAAPDGGPPRVGFVVGRTVGGAVARNAVTRRLRAVARDRLGLLPPGSCLVVRALPSAATADSARLSGDFDACLDRLLTPSDAGP
jgi:ribonuclease P protein component